MAEFGKKIYLKNSAGTQQTAKIYSTTGESQTPYFPLVVDGVQGYATLVSTSDSRATSGRVKHSNGNTYAIGTMGVVPYSSQLITSVGGGTFTVPAGVTKLRVTCVGGGSGPVGVTYRYSDADSATLTGGAGGRTVFYSVGANGGASPQVVIDNAMDADGASYTYVKSTRIAVGANNGVEATSRLTKGGAALALTNYAGGVVGYAGAGGDIHISTGYGWWGCSGASGYKATGTINVTAGSTISYSVGSGGAAARRQWDEIHSITNGYPGAILVEWGQGIQ